MGQHFKFMAQGVVQVLKTKIELLVTYNLP